MCSDELLDLLVVEKIRYRRVFFRHHGLGPWCCVECGEDIVLDDLNVHHLDEDHANESPENLVAIHRSCHASLHGRQRGITPGMGATRWSRPGAGARHAAVMAALPRTTCEDCGQEFLACHITRHRGSRECERQKAKLRKTIPGEENYAVLQEQVAVA